MEKVRDRPAAAKAPARPRRPASAKASAVRRSFSEGGSAKSEGGQARLRVAVTDGLGVPVRAAGLARWLARIAPATARGRVTVALVTDRQIRRLNRRYRRLDRPTDVLSFPTPKPDRLAGGSRRDGHLGDLAISVDTARRQAGRRGHSLGTELRVLALHGLLHLLGYDHERDRGEMARVECRLRRRGGLARALTEPT